MNNWAIFKEDKIYYKLSNQIVIKAGEDFNLEIDYILKGKSDDFTEIKEIIEFFKSGYYRDLTHVPQKVVLEHCKNKLNSVVEQYQQDIDLNNFEKDPHIIERARKIITKATECLKSI